MSLIETSFIYEDKFIAVCKAVYQNEKGERVIHIDIGLKDQNGDILIYNTAASYLAE